MQIKIKTPAKINLTLEIVNKRPDGYHNIKSVMQMIDLYDFLTIKAEKSNKSSIFLDGTSSEIPYNEKNLVYKAAQIFYEKTKLSGYKTDIFIEKNIPVSAGLAGGSANAAGTIYGLNKLFDNILSDKEMHELCKPLGSDLNVCLEGGCLLATGRGEIIQKLPFVKSKVSLIKPIGLGISAKEAYTKYSGLKNKPDYDMTTKLTDAIKIGTDLNQFLYNDLETAVFNDYPQLKQIKTLYPKSVMSGSGSTYFILTGDIPPIENYWVKTGLNFVADGVSLA
ncbi:MAG: 4-(cytidine 5'-diphospho)-2-C-methyl-D-erythritol kinase [Candidatus Gastranaerophilales bacterium]|nr:4-(cytidine 5'-diphospho)-2-C-methyl-D-erythritol kinase [Candidatus Gastranaerophilales bacterium]